jgi:hypothetical protein
MAIQTLTVQTVPFQSHLEQTLTAATSVDVNFVNDGYSILVVNNTSGGAINVKIVSVPDNAGRIDEDLTTTGYSQPAGIQIYGPFRPVWFNDQGKVSVTLGQTANMSLGVFKLQF